MYEDYFLILSDQLKQTKMLQGINLIYWPKVG